MSYEAPYAGLKVVDLSQGLAAPYCAMLLAQNGADVIKVEPVGGDWSRILNQNYGDHTAFSITANLGKRSIAIDLKSDEGKELLWRLLDGADVLIEGFRPGVMNRLGFGYDAVAARVPRILYVAVSGFGSAHPLAARPAMDPVLQAYTGLVLANKGDDGIPRRAPYSAVDMSAALYAFQAVSAALYARRDMGVGRHIEISLLGAAAAVQAVRVVATWLGGADAPISTPPSGSFEATDGWLQIQVVKDKDWQRLCALLDLPELANDPLYSSRNLRNGRRLELYELLRPIFRSRSLDELCEALTEADILHERLNSYADFLEQERAADTGVVSWLHQPDVPKLIPMPNIPGQASLVSGEFRAKAPTCGEHTDAIMKLHGFSQAQVDALCDKGVLSRAGESRGGPQVEPA